jgi:hypothetical protein
MDWNEKSCSYIMRSGRELSTNYGALGIDLGLTVYDGFCLEDSTPRPLQADLDAAEQMELGFYMADLWQKYAVEAGIVFEREDKGRQNRAARTGKKTRQEVDHMCGDPMCHDINHLRIVTVIDET